MKKTENWNYSKNKKDQLSIYLIKLLMIEFQTFMNPNIS